MILKSLMTPRAVTKPKLDSNSIIATGKTASGQNVTSDSALRVAAVYSCVRVLSQSLSALPLGLYRKEGNKRQEATDHPLHSVLSVLPNQEMTSFNLRTQIMASLLLQGRAYNQVLRDRAGRVAEIWPVMPGTAQLDRSKAGNLVLVVDKEPNAWPMSKVWRIAGLTTNGIEGLTPIGLMRETIGTALAMEQYSAAIYGNGAKPGGVLQMGGKLSKDGQARLLESWNSTHGGANNANKVGLLQEGMKWQQISMTAEDAQFIESRKYNRSEIAGIYGVPPHLIGDLDKATFSNIEHQNLQLVIHTLLPHICNLEQTIIRDLLLPSERGIYYSKFSVDALLRGDSAARAAFYKELFNVGAFSPDDIRRLEDENPIENGSGANHFVNSASITLENAANATPNNTQD